MKEATDEYRRILKKGYSLAGPEFLSLRLGLIFTIIETEEAKGLHNHAVDEIETILRERRNEFLKDVSKLIVRFSQEKPNVEEKEQQESQNKT